MFPTFQVVRTLQESGAGLSTQWAIWSPNIIQHSQSVVNFWSKSVFVVLYFIFYLNTCRHPVVSFPGSKRSKSEISILSLSIEDPSCHDGMIRISEKLVPYIPTLPDGNNQKTVVFGDQLYIERGKIFFYFFIF